MGEYAIKKTDGMLALHGKNGIPLISLKKKANEMTITFHNKNIDEDGLLMATKAKFGETFSNTVICKSAEDASLCQEIFMQLASDGFVSELNGMVGMDWQDLEEVCFCNTQGHYFHIEFDKDKFDHAYEPFMNQITEEYGEPYSAIVFVEGVYPYQMSEVNKSIERTIKNKNSKIVFQFFSPESTERRSVNAWVFPTTA